MGRTVPIVAAIVVANLANAALNWVLIFGHLGFPAMGVVGSAWATSVSWGLLVVGPVARCQAGAGAVAFPVPA